jgi:hypothetical protein
MVYYFDFGCVVFWGLSKEIERCGALPATRRLPRACRAAAAGPSTSAASAAAGP